MTATITINILSAVAAVANPVLHHFSRHVTVDYDDKLTVRCLRCLRVPRRYSW